jgi:asparagine synthase (glutamine-hydrolysing)
MCGINGFNFEHQDLINSMNKRLRHRGPDGSSSFVNGKLSLGHARLAIIDLSNAAIQPMSYISKARNIKIVFNGEIYNYIEVKSQLKELGYVFKTTSDTEVILASYIEWAEDCVNHFNGMWAFCIYDEDKNLLFCSRDRLGVKPFYYYNKNDLFIFSSELKSILEHSALNICSSDNINPEAVELYFALGYVPSPKSIYKNINKLEAGHNLIFDLESKSISEYYKFFEIDRITNNLNHDQLLEEGMYILHDATKLRMRSDVNVGAFLSGGLDSSAVVGEMQKFTEIEKLHTFSIGFEDKKLDESPYINLVKDYFGTQHRHYIYKEEDYRSLWNDYSEIFDEPFGDYSSFPSHKVCQLASNEVKVVLSGDGGDEIFGGYPLYNIGYAIEKIRYMPPIIRELMFKASSFAKGIHPKFNKINELIKLSLKDKNTFHSQMFDESRYKPKVFQDWSLEKMDYALLLADNNLAEALRIYDLLNNTLADNYLVKVDRSSMANSIEVRSPFLDYRFVQFAQKIPVKKKVGVSGTKILMREMISDIVPKAIINRNKMGFTPPIHEWIYNHIDENRLKKYLQYIENINLDLYNFYRKIINKPNKVYMDDFYMIKLVIFGKWFERWIIRKVIE